MGPEHAIEILRWLEAAAVDAWVDGGWGVDALLGVQSRDHDDLDLLVRLSDVPRVRAALEPRGFAVFEDELPTRFVMRAPDDRRIDFHTVTFDAQGGGSQVQPGGGEFRYPPEGFTSGTIAGSTVRCMSAEVQLLCHLGYEPDATDRHDVRRLHERFGLPLPDGYR